MALPLQRKTVHWCKHPTAEQLDIGENTQPNGKRKSNIEILTMSGSSKQKIPGNTEILYDTTAEADPVATFQPRAGESHSAFFSSVQEYSLGELTQVHKAGIGKFKKVKVI